MANLNLSDIPTALAGVPTTLAEIVPGGLIYPDSNSTVAGEVDFALWWINAITVFFFVAIIAVMVYFAMKYRRHSENEHAEHTSHHNTGLELAWTLPPLVIVLWLFWIGFAGYWKLVTIPENAYEIQVRAQKWNWTFIHPNGYQSNVLEVPAGRPIKLTMSSSDVLHSLFVPAFRVKKDVVPGRYSQLWFEAIAPTPHADDTFEGEELDTQARAALTENVRAEMSRSLKDGETLDEAALAAEVDKQWNATKEDGTPKIDEKAKRELVFPILAARAAEHGHQLYCTEYCGTSHSDMLAKVVVHKADWLPPDSLIGTPVQKGKQLFAIKGCAACHGVAATDPSTCPTFANGVFMQERTMQDGSKVTADDNYLSESILNPQVKKVAGYSLNMPVIQGITQEEVDYLIAYLKSLGPPVEGAEGEGEGEGEQAEPDAEPAEAALIDVDAEWAQVAHAVPVATADEQEKDGEDAKDPLDDPELIAKGKTLFTAKICATCHQVDPEVPSPAGDALKATKFMGKFWGEKRTVTKGPGGEEIEVVFDAAYADESIAEPMKLIVKGSVPGMAPLPTTPEERQALVAYLKSLSD